MKVKRYKLKIDVKTHEDTIRCPSCRQMMIVWEEYEAWVENAVPGRKKNVTCCHCKLKLEIELINLT
jgi:hypothetical protein